MSVSIPKYTMTVTGKYLDYRYPCNFAKSQENCDLIVDIDNEDFPWVGIQNSFETGYFSNGRYFLNRVSCSCPSILKKLSQQIQLLFKKKVTKRNCKVHNKEFDVWLKTDFSLRWDTLLPVMHVMYQNKLFFPNIHNLKMVKDHDRISSDL